MEFREQPGGEHWKANQLVDGVLFEWSIVQPKESYFDTELWVGDLFFGSQESTTYRKAVKAAEQLRQDYYNQEEEE